LIVQEVVTINGYSNNIALYHVTQEVNGLC